MMRWWDAVRAGTATGLCCCCCCTQKQAAPHDGTNGSRPQSLMKRSQGFLAPGGAQHPADVVQPWKMDEYHPHPSPSSLHSSRFVLGRSHPYIRLFIHLYSSLSVSVGWETELGSRFVDLDSAMSALACIEALYLLCRCSDFSLFFSVHFILF